MMLMILRRYTASSFVMINSHVIPGFLRFQSLFSESNNKIDDNEGSQPMLSVNGEARPTSLSRGLYLSPLFWQDNSPLSSSEIKVLDLDTWRISSSLAQVSKSVDYQTDKRLIGVEEMGGNVAKVGNEPDFDEIEDMRIRGNLFYKIDRGSKEFEEYKFDFHRRKSRFNEDAEKESKKSFCDQSVSSGREDHKAKDNSGSNLVSSFVDQENISRIIKDKYIVCASEKDMDSSRVEKKRRLPTFNQFTGPYHEPFCLDIYISKASIRACVIHRVSSKVVAVAHSISKDMKFDLNSTRNATTCSAVGKILAQRALADDIHDVIFMPRKGDKLVGKLQIVLQAIISGGVNVKVKVKQRHVKKAGSHIAVENHVVRV